MTVSSTALAPPLTWAHLRAVPVDDPELDQWALRPLGAKGRPDTDRTFRRLLFDPNLGVLLKFAARIGNGVETTDGGRSIRHEVSITATPARAMAGCHRTARADRRAGRPLCGVAFIQRTVLAQVHVDPSGRQQLGSSIRDKRHIHVARLAEEKAAPGG